MATTRRGTECQRPAIRGKKRCNLHGGKSTGAKGNRNAWKHGRYAAETRALERELRSILADNLAGLEGLNP
ncbi:HGGxSTG domain-containing protein [Altererythrobacter sp. MF3-039]|uniref:HGGxSTG domain-containing protein n=1 Tax=Altererythrobacter sp. MF3-039 TaxID=3252901 RepID=UPI00390C50EA